eukprot:2810192-Rhodomonas_salina.1
MSHVQWSHCLRVSEDALSLTVSVPVVQTRRKAAIQSQQKSAKVSSSQQKEQNSYLPDQRYPSRAA